MAIMAMTIKVILDTTKTALSEPLSSECLDKYFWKKPKLQSVNGIRRTNGGCQNTGHNNPCKGAGKAGRQYDKNTPPNFESAVIRIKHSTNNTDTNNCGERNNSRP